MTDRSLRDTLTVAAGHAARLGLALLASVIVARVLGPAGMGIVTLAMAVVGVAVALSEPGLRVMAGRDIAVALVAGDQAGAATTARAYLGGRLLLAVPLATAATWWVALGGGPQLRGDPALWALIPAVVMGAVLGSYAQALAEMTSSFRSAALLIGGVGGMRSLVLLGLAAAGWLSPRSWLGVEAASGLMGLALLAWAVGSPLPDVMRPSFQGTWALLRRCGWLGIGVVMGLLLTRVDVLALARGASAEEVGIYGVAAALAARGDLLKNAVLTVWYPPISAGDPRQLGALVAGARRDAGRMALLYAAYSAAAVAALVVGAGPQFIPGLVPLIFLLGGGAAQLRFEPEALILYAHWPRAVAVSDTLLTVTVAAGAVWAAGHAGAGGVAAVMLLARLVVGWGKVRAARWWVARAADVSGGGA